MLSAPLRALPVVGALQAAGQVVPVVAPDSPVISHVRQQAREVRRDVIAMALKKRFAHAMSPGERALGLAVEAGQAVRHLIRKEAGNRLAQLSGETATVGFMSELDECPYRLRVGNIAVALLPPAEGRPLRKRAYPILWRLVEDGRFARFVHALPCSVIVLGAMLRCLIVARHHEHATIGVVADQVPACGAAGPVVFVIDPEAHAVLPGLIDSPADGLEHFLGQVIDRETVHGVDVEIEDACVPEVPYLSAHLVFLKRGVPEPHDVRTVVVSRCGELLDEVVAQGHLSPLSYFRIIPSVLPTSLRRCAPTSPAQTWPNRCSWRWFRAPVLRRRRSWGGSRRIAWTCER